MKTIKFAENLRSLRTTKNMRQEDLAALVNVNRRTVGAWERGICEPNFETLAKLCEIFNETFDSILT